jgi:hypothetical protein
MGSILSKTSKCLKMNPGPLIKSKPASTWNRIQSGLRGHVACEGLRDWIGLSWVPPMEPSVIADA